MTGAGSGARSVKNGGAAMYVDASSHRYVPPSGIGQRAPALVALEDGRVGLRKSSGETASPIVLRTSSGPGQMSARKTASPSVPRPSGSVVRSMSTRPASAKATTSGGEAR